MSRRPWLLALALALMAPLAEASLTRASAPALGSPALTLASPAATPEPSEFSLFEGTELAVAASAPQRADSFHPLAAVSLLDERLQTELAAPLEPSYPKTRYRVFEFLRMPILGVEKGVSLELDWGCASLSCGLASGTVGWLSEDPLGPVDSPNLYGYVGLRPHEKTDPLGLEGVGDFLKRKWGEFSNWWSGLGSKAREKAEKGLDLSLTPPPDPTTDPFGAREAFKEVGLEGQYNREKAARAGAEVRRDVVRAGGLAAQGAVEAGKFYAENKVVGLAIGALAKGASGPGRWATAREAMSARAAAYQAQISGRAAGEVYLVNGVKFDALVGGTLREAKGPGYAGFVKDGKFVEWFEGADSMVDQAARQIGAAGATPIEWHIAEEEAAQAIRKLLAADPRTSGVKVLYTPPVS